MCLKILYWYPPATFCPELLVDAVLSARPVPGGKMLCRRQQPCVYLMRQHLKKDQSTALNVASTAETVCSALENAFDLLVLCAERF